jgi:hypothetical protein
MSAYRVRVAGRAAHAGLEPERGVSRMDGDPGPQSVPPVRL